MLQSNFHNNYGLKFYAVSIVSKGGFNRRSINQQSKETGKLLGSRNRNSYHRRIQKNLLDWVHV